MKNNYLWKAFLSISLLLVISCSNDENLLPIPEEYLTAKVDGENLNLSTSNGLFFAQKQLSPYGSLDLFVKVTSVDGRTIEFKIRNYKGQNNYGIGNRDVLENSYVSNGNWCNYIEDKASGQWSTIHNSYYPGLLPNFVEIREDNGEYITGEFSFEGREETGASSKLISEGTFGLKVKP